MDTRSALPPAIAEPLCGWRERRDLISVKPQGYMRPSRAGLHGFSGVISAGVDEGGRGEASDSRGGGRITARIRILKDRLSWH